ncbi:MAG: hypothetical protein AB7S81_08130 [Bdellovibrionales bacterium]
MRFSPHSSKKISVIPDKRPKGVKVRNPIFLCPELATFIFFVNSGNNQMDLQKRSIPSTFFRDEPKKERSKNPNAVAMQALGRVFCLPIYRFPFFSGTG